MACLSQVLNLENMLNQILDLEKVKHGGAVTSSLFILIEAIVTGKQAAAAINCYRQNLSWSWFGMSNKETGL